MVSANHGLDLIFERIGSYRVETKLASGGMGAVYRASHQFLPRRAAIKVMHADMASIPTASDRMLQEAQILESIDHPAIVKVFDVGLLDDGRPWVAMELLDGQTLADHLFVHHRLEPREAARIIVAIAGALIRSHSSGVVHRDIKPENIMLVPGDDGLQVKVIDWGIAHLTTTMNDRLTQHDYSPGTPCYMSPEQLRGQSIDGRTDTYALGVVAYEMLAGEPPFDGANPMDIAVKTLHNAVPALPPELRVPLAVEGVIRAMLAKDPAQRPSLDAVCAGFANWEYALDGDSESEDDDDYEDIHLEVEIDVDFAERNCVSGEIIC